MEGRSLVVRSCDLAIIWSDYHSCLNSFLICSVFTINAIVSSIHFWFHVIFKSLDFTDLICISLVLFLFDYSLLILVNLIHFLIIYYYHYFAFMSFVYHDLIFSLLLRFLLHLKYLYVHIIMYLLPCGGHLKVGLGPRGKHEKSV